MVQITGGNKPVQINSTRKSKFWKVDTLFLTTFYVDETNMKNKDTMISSSARFPCILNSIKYLVYILNPEEHLMTTLIKASAIIIAVLPCDNACFVFGAVNRLPLWPMSGSMKTVIKAACITG